MTTRTEKGISLARGPALVLGTILLAAGLYFLYRAHSFPRWANFPNGTAHKDGNFFLGIFGANGWTGEFTAVAGGLLLFGAAHHVLAKTMSLIVGCALGAAAVIAVVSGNVLGMAATNGWTELGWGIAAAILLFNAMIPRRTRTIEEPVAAGGVAAGGMTARERRRERHHEEEAALAGAGAGVAGERMAEHHRMHERDRMAGDQPVAGDRPVADERAADEGMTGDRMAEDRPMADDRMVEDRPMAGDRMAEDETAVHQRAARDGMAENGMANNDRMADDGMANNDETQMLQDRPRRFQRSGTMDDGVAGDGTAANGEQTLTGRRRSGGLLAGLFHRD